MFKIITPEDQVISSDSVTGTVWSNNAPILTSFFTSSIQAASNTGKFYYHVYQTSSTDSTAAVQFDMAYADKMGSGSNFYNALVTGSSPTRTIYGQYQNIVLGDDTEPFSFGGVTSSYFYVIAPERARFKEKLLPGTMTLRLSGSGQPSNSIELTDNSKVVTSTTFNNAGRVFQIVSGSAGNVYTTVNANGYSVASGSYGLFLPDIATIILNGQALDDSNIKTGGGINLSTERQMDVNNSNMNRLLNAMKRKGFFKLNSEETLTSDFLFIRAKNQEFNFSENPSFISGSTGAVLYDSFVNNPQVYITTVGMYNEANELLAVAKMSRPLLKDFTKEILVRVKLDF